MSTDSALSVRRGIRSRDVSRMNRSKALTITIGVGLAIGALITAFPFIWMIASSFKPQSESLDFPPTILPQAPTLEYYQTLFTELDFGRYLDATRSSSC